MNIEQLGNILKRTFPCNNDVAAVVLTTLSLLLPSERVVLSNQHSEHALLIVIHGSSAIKWTIQSLVSTEAWTFRIYLPGKRVESVQGNESGAKGLRRTERRQ